MRRHSAPSSLTDVVSVGRGGLSPRSIRVPVGRTRLTIGRKKTVGHGGAVRTYLRPTYRRYGWNSDTTRENSSRCLIMSHCSYLVLLIVDWPHRRLIQRGGRSIEPFLLRFSSSLGCNYAPGHPHPTSRYVRNYSR